MYDSNQISPEDMPKSLKELSDPKWKGKLGWAPGNGSFQAHVSVLRNVWGEEETKAWLEGVKNNEPKSYPKNSPQVKEANEGSLVIGWVNHYYLHRVDPNGRTAVNYSFPQEDVGNILMVSGAGIRKGSVNKETAEKVLGYLVSKEGQSHFAMNNYEYPTRPNVQTNPDVPDLDLGSVMDIPQEYLIDIGPTRSLLQRLCIAMIRLMGLLSVLLTIAPLIGIAFLIVFPPQDPFGGNRHHWVYFLQTGLTHFLSTAWWSLCCRQSLQPWLEGGWLGWSIGVRI